MNEAVRLVLEEDFTVSRAAVFLNGFKVNPVPRMTLQDRIKREDPTEEPKVGRPHGLSKEVEEALVKCLVMCAEFQYPMRKRDLMLLVQAYCNENSIETRFPDNKPGREWVLGFQKRWAHRVKVKKPSNIKRSQAAVSPAIVRDFFTALGPNIENIPATHIFNYDKTNLRDDPGAENAFFAVGSKYQEQVRNHSKVAFSIMYCCSASGLMLPPMVVYKQPQSILFQNWCENGPAGSTNAASKSGWFDMAKFNQWFKQVFVEHIQTLPQEEVKVLIGDNLAAHLSPYVTTLCELHNIRFCFLPENSTHLLQPLDVSVFAPMKRYWREVLTEWKEQCVREEKNYSTIPKPQFPLLLSRLMEKDYSESIRSGFESCGLFPFNVERALSKLPMEQREVETQVQQQLLRRLESLRYEQPRKTHTGRPKKKGGLYLCYFKNTYIYTCPP